MRVEKVIALVRQRKEKGREKRRGYERRERIGRREDRRG